MGLLNLKTDLKSLKYGKDQVGGGSSKQPFVRKPIPDSFSGVGNTGGLDMFVRGGTLAIGKTADDASRLTQLLLTPSTFQGPAFTAQQNLLSRQGVQTQASPRGLNEGPYLPTSTISQAVISATGLHFNKQGLNPIPGLVGSLSTYSDAVTYRQEPSDNRLVKFTEDFVDKGTSGNTLFSYPGGPGSILGAGETKIQIPIEQRTGANGINAGYRYPTKYVDLKDAQLLLGASNKAILPEEVTGIYYSDQLDKYELVQTFGANKNQDLISKAFADSNPVGTRIGGINIDQNSDYAIESGLDTPDSFELFTPRVSSDGLYEGNKPSPFERSMGTTPFTGDDPFTKPTLQADGQDQQVTNLEAQTYTQEQLQQAPSYRKEGKPQDFRKQLRDVKAPNYETQNIENRVHLGDPGVKGDVSNYQTGKVVGGKIQAVDKINALPIYSSTNVATTKDETVNDLCKFRIAILDSAGGSRKEFIHFRAFLDTISDNFSAQWDSFKYTGRGENFYTYGGFDRKVSLGWTVFAQSKQELIPMYKKLNFLASTLAPTYNGGYMQGSFAQLTIGGYLYEMPGIITGLNYELSQEAPWEIGITGEGFENQKGDSSVKELPHMIKVSGFEFIPIPNFIPQKQKNTYGKDKITYGKQRFISLSNGANNNYDS
jgi:hypothetical protein